MALQEGAPEKYPVKTRKLVRKAESWWLLLLRDGAGRVRLERRPSAGIWSGLHCLPIYFQRSDLVAYSTSIGSARILELSPFLHVLTHRDLHLHPVVVEVDAEAALVHESAWFSREQWATLGLPAPIRKLLDSIE